MAAQNENTEPPFRTTPLTPEVREWALRQHTDAEVIAALWEAKEQHGPELAALIEELEQEVYNSEHRPQS